MEKSGGHASERSHRFGYAEMLRDVLVASIDRGQFLIATISLVTTILVLKLPAEATIALIVRVLDSLERACIWGYVMAAVLAVIGLCRWRRQRQSAVSEQGK